MRVQWSSTRNGHQKKTEVNEVNLEQCARQVIASMKKVFGPDPLQWNDDTWETFITPWTDEYISNHFTFDGAVKKENLDDQISVLLDEPSGDSQ